MFYSILLANCHFVVSVFTGYFLDSKSNRWSYEAVDLDSRCDCPHCGGRDITKIDRMNGYLSYSRVKGDTTLNKAKMDEIADRKSM